MSYSKLYTGFYQGSKQEGKEKQPFLNGGYLKKGFAFEDVANEPNILGVLAENVVMVDFDSEADAKAFKAILASQGLKVPTMRTTRGMHFYFKANEEVVDRAHTHVPVACGLVCDFKLGSKKGLDLIKYRGEMRQWENEDAELIPVPKFLAKIGPNVGAVSLTNLTEGSRNDALFAFVGKLKRKGFDADETHKLIQVINKLVLPHPLNDREIDTICRPESYNGAYDAKEKEEDGENKLSNPDIAKMLMAQHHFKLIGGALFGVMNGIYKAIDKNEFNRLVYAIDENATSNRRKEVFDYCTAMCQSYEPEEVMKNPQLIPFANGVVDIMKGTVEPFENFDMPFTNRIDFDFPVHSDGTPIDPVELNAYNPELDGFMEAITCGNGQRQQQLYEMAGSCLYRKNALRGIFILVGDRANGKSTFLKFLNYCLGRDNVSNLSLHDLNEPFYVTAIQGKLANLGDDIGDNFVADSSVLKSIATSDRIMGNIKYHDPVMFTPYSTLIFTANFIPRISDPTGAVQTRLQFVKFEADFSKTPDIGILERLCTPEIASLFLARAAWHFTRALSLGRFLPSLDTFEVTEEFSRASNPVLLFLDEEYQDLGELVDVEVSEVYDKFVRFCDAEGCSKMSRTMFSRRMKAAVGGLTICTKRGFMNKVVRAFKGEHLTRKQ